MKILQVHNIYQGKTGEETVVDQEKRILEENGHSVVQYIKDNTGLENFNGLGKLNMLLSLTSSRAIAKEFDAVLKTEKPDICHVHNTFPLITPVIYRVCQDNGIPVIQTLHNYKMVCTNSLLFRGDEVCELCLDKSLYNSIKYKCYRNSYVATAAQAHVIQHHRKIGTWENYIDKYVCLTDFQKEKIFRGKLQQKVFIKPNFLGRNNLSIEREDFFLFVGRLNNSKGLQDLLHLFRRNTKSRFVLIGKADEPQIFEEFNNVEHLGERERSVVIDHMRRCKAVLFPSKYYEGMPMVILEAFSLRKPVISRDRGAMASMIQHGYNGLKYEIIEDFVIAVRSFEERPEWVRELGENAYTDFLDKYTEERGYENLIKLYSEVLKSKSNVS